MGSQNGLMFFSIRQTLFSWQENFSLILFAIANEKQASSPRLVSNLFPEAGLRRLPCQRNISNYFSITSPLESNSGKMDS